MDTIEAIFTRRSVRHYTNQPIDEEDIHLLLKAGMQSPTAGNAQPCHFVLVKDHALLERIPEFHTSAAFVPNAPLGILICADTIIAKPNRWLLDCSTAAQSILLAAHARQLGACWLGIEPVPERINGFRQLFNLPEHIAPVCMITVGHPAKTPPPEERYNPERVHINGW
jgi:nitroreductase